MLGQTPVAALGGNCGCSLHFLLLHFPSTELKEGNSSCNKGQALFNFWPIWRNTWHCTTEKPPLSVGHTSFSRWGLKKFFESTLFSAVQNFEHSRMGCLSCCSSGSWPQYRKLNLKLQFQNQNSLAVTFYNYGTFFKVFISCINVDTSFFTLPFQWQIMRELALVSFSALSLLEESTNYRFRVSTWVKKVFVF